VVGELLPWFAGAQLVQPGVRVLGYLCVNGGSGTGACTGAGVMWPLRAGLRSLRGGLVVASCRGRVRPVAAPIYRKSTPMDVGVGRCRSCVSEALRAWLHFGLYQVPRKACALNSLGVIEVAFLDRCIWRATTIRQGYAAAL
jgi:hypothetical protein